jgi:acyl carrier protein
MSKVIKNAPLLMLALFFLILCYAQHIKSAERPITHNDDLVTFIAPLPFVSLSLDALISTIEKEFGVKISTSPAASGLVVCGLRRNVVAAIEELKQFKK